MKTFRFVSIAMFTGLLGSELSGALVDAGSAQDEHSTTAFRDDNAVELQQRRDREQALLIAERQAELFRREGRQEQAEAAELEAAGIRDMLDRHERERIELRLHELHQEIDRLREQQQHEDADRLEREASHFEHKLHEIQLRKHEQEHDRRIRHLFEAAEHLDAAGMHELAGELRRHVETSRHEIHEDHRDNLHNHVEHLTGIVQDLRQQMNQLRRDLQALENQIRD